MEATDIFCSWHRLRRVPKIWPSRLCQRWGVRRLGCDPSSQGCTTAKSESHSVVPDSLQPHGLHSPWNSPGQNTGAGSLSLLQGISPTHGLKPRSPTLQADSLPTEPSDQIRSVAQSCPTLCDPMNPSTSGLPVHHQLPEFTQTHVHRVSDAIQPSHPLSSPSPPAPNPSQHQGLFQ